jgi:hypothetical protein
MAGRGNPSFLKNQKAKKRQEKASEKRAARQARNAEKAAARAARESGVEGPELLDGEEPGAMDGQDASPDEAV